MTTTLITGATRGLGRESARRLIEQGHRVYIGARDAERGKQTADELGAQWIVLDVADDASVAAAVADFAQREDHLDVLVNNAGAFEGDNFNPEDVTAEMMKHIYEPNVFGVVRMIHAFVPLLRRSRSPVIVNVSSGLGSFAVVTDPRAAEAVQQVPAYASSKAAVSMLTIQYAKGLPDIRINAVEPGYTATDMNDNRGYQTLQQGTDAIVKLATIGADGPTGGFFDRNGQHPW